VSGKQQADDAKGIAMTTATTARLSRSEGELSRLTLIRIGRNEALARRSDREPRRSGDRLPFRCECEGERCREALLLTRTEYEYVRAQPGRLLVSPGHQVTGAEFTEHVAGCFVLQTRTRRRRVR
jgi:hypothetical protein